MPLSPVVEKFVRGIEQLDLLKDGVKFLIGTAAGWAWKMLYDRWWKTRKARKFWRPFLSKDLHIVLGRFGEFEEFERSGFIGVGDAFALAELQRFLATMGIREPHVVYADRVEGDALKHPLILLGGPDCNVITSEALKLIRTTLRLGDPSIHEIAIRDTSTHPPHLYIPRAPTAQEAGSDFGVVFRVPNPFSADKAALIIAGAFGHGTWAAARYLISPEFLRKQAAISGFLECLVETDIVRDTPQQIRPVVVRPIA